VLLTDTVTVSSLARNQRRDAEVAEGAKETDVRRLAQGGRRDRAESFFPPKGVILGATSVYKCDKGLFARGFCILKCVHRCVQKCVQCVQSVSEWLRVGELRVERKPDSRGPSVESRAGEGMATRSIIR
jgi:hypothetical protein